MYVCMYACIHVYDATHIFTYSKSPQQAQQLKLEFAKRLRWVFRAYYQIYVRILFSETEQKPELSFPQSGQSESKSQANKLK